MYVCVCVNRNYLKINHMSWYALKTTKPNQTKISTTPLLSASFFSFSINLLFLSTTLFFTLWPLSTLSTPSFPPSPLPPPFSGHKSRLSWSIERDRLMKPKNKCVSIKWRYHTITITKPTYIKISLIKITVSFWNFETLKGNQDICISGSFNQMSQMSAPKQGYFLSSVFD